MDSRCNKNNAVTSGPPLAVTHADNMLRVTTRTTVLQTSPETPSIQGMTTSITGTNGEAIRILHQNIQGLRWKSDEVIESLYPSLPHIVCFTEHHLNKQEINLI